MNTDTYDRIEWTGGPVQEAFLLNEAGTLRIANLGMIFELFGQTIFQVNDGPAENDNVREVADFETWELAVVELAMELAA